VADVNSPLKTVLEDVSRQTNFSAESTGQGWLDPIWKLFASSQNVKKEKTPVETEFDALFKFTEVKDSKPSQLSNYGNEFQNILKCSVPADCNIDKLDLSEITSQVQAQKGGFFNQLGKTEKNIDSLLSGFKNGTVGPDIAVLLKKPLGNLNDLVGGGIKDKINKEWADVFTKSQAAEKGYPFTNDGEGDLTELTKYLNPVNGTLSDFYAKRLQKYFEGEAPNLKVKETSEVKFSDDFVKYLNNAFRLREALFGKNATPAFKYDLKLQKINDALIEIKIDGQTINTDATGSVTFNFPSTGGENGAFINFSSTADPTSGKPTSANTSSPPVSTTNTSPQGVQNSGNSQPGSGNRSFQGPWGLFKFVEAGSPKKQPGGEYILTYNVGGKTVIATIKPTGGDLFDRTYFTSVRAPQTILK
jgi:type VI protein secretion system component VasK